MIAEVTVCSGRMINHRGATREGAEISLQNWRRTIAWGYKVDYLIILNPLMKTNQPSSRSKCWHLNMTFNLGEWETVHGWFYVSALCRCSRVDAASSLQRCTDVQMLLFVQCLKVNRSKLYWKFGQAVTNRLKTRRESIQMFSTIIMLQEMVFLISVLYNNLLKLAFFSKTKTLFLLRFL